MVILVFSLFFIFMPFLLISPLKIRIIIRHNDHDDETIIHLGFFWGLINLKINIKSMGLSLNKIISLLNLNTNFADNNQAKVEQKINLEYIIDLIKHIDVQIVKNLWKLRKKFIPPVKCRKIMWITKVGLGDAAETGIYTGLLWSIKGMLFSFINQMEHWQVKRVDLNVLPNFKAKVFEIYVDCIFKFTIGHIIIAGIKFTCYLVLFWLKGGETNGRSSNRSVNENSYGKY